MSENRVFITGLSALSASGETAEKTWESVLAGRHGLESLQNWDVSGWPVQIGGELKNFQPAKMLPDRKLIKVISRQDVMGIHAAVSAVEHSAMIPHRDTLADTNDFNEQTAVFVGSPGNKYFQQYDFLPLLAKTNDMKGFAEHLFEEVHPTWLLRILPNNVLAYAGITYGFKGPNHNITNHAVSGSQAIIEAFQAIKCGQAQRAVVVAYDMGVEPQSLFYYDKLGVVSPTHLRPFDITHNGTVLAEGAAALILESEASVLARNATCYGEVLGGMSSSEGSGLFSIEEDGEALSVLLEKTLSQCELSANSIDYIVAHGNGNSKSDDSEAKAIQQVFGVAKPVTAFKWSMGHTLSASGIMDAVLNCYALQNKCIPGIAGLTQVADNCAGLSLSATHRTLTQNNAHSLLINRGFASMNACLVIKSCE